MGTKNLESKEKTSLHIPAWYQKKGDASPALVSTG
jgi:hypothetical protein